MSTILFSCPFCKAQVKAPEQAAGKNARCPKCRKKSTVPDPFPEKAFFDFQQTSVAKPIVREDALTEKQEPPRKSSGGCARALLWFFFILIVIGAELLHRLPPSFKIEDGILYKIGPSSDLTHLTSLVLAFLIFCALDRLLLSGKGD